MGGMIVSLIISLSVAGLLFAAALHSRRFFAGEPLAWIRHKEGFHIGVRMGTPDAQLPKGTAEALDAIEAVLDDRFPKWREKADLLIEIHPFGATLKGPFCSTGFQSRDGTPVNEPRTPEQVAATMRVVGTIRFDRLWPWTKRRATILISGAKFGASHSEAVLGESAKPDRDIGGTALFYEVAQRFVPMALEGFKAPELSAMRRHYQELERALLDAYRERFSQD